MAGTIIGETKRKAKKRPKDAQLAGIKKRERVSLFHGRKLFHPSNVARMQIVRFNSNGGSRTSITCQRNILFYSRG
jgi:hypothetical protein